MEGLSSIKPVSFICSLAYFPEFLWKTTLAYAKSLRLMQTNAPLVQESSYAFRISFLVSVPESRPIETRYCCIFHTMRRNPETLATAEPSSTYLAIEMYWLG